MKKPNSFVFLFRCFRDTIFGTLLLLALPKLYMLNSNSISSITMKLKIGFFDYLKIAFLGCIDILVISTTIAFIISAIYNIVLYQYYSLFYYNRIIRLTVDQNYIIRDSFVELSDGRTIPIRISKIMMGKPEEEKEEQEAGE